MMLQLNCFSFSKWSCGFLHIGLAVGQCHKTSKRCLTDEIIFWMPSQLLFRIAGHDSRRILKRTVQIQETVYKTEIDSSGIRLPSAVCKVNLKSSKLRTHTSYGYCDDALLSAQEQQLLPKAFSTKPMFVRYFYGCEKTRFLPIHFLIVPLAEDEFQAIFQVHLRFFLIFSALLQMGKEQSGFSKSVCYPLTKGLRQVRMSVVENKAIGFV